MYDFLNDTRFKGIEKFDRKVWLSSPTITKGSNGSSHNSAEYH